MREGVREREAVAAAAAPKEAAAAAAGAAGKRAAAGAAGKSRGHESGVLRPAAHGSMAA